MGLLDYVGDDDLFDSRELFDAYGADEMDEDDEAAYQELKAEVESYAGDSMSDGIGFIRGSYFQEYAKEFASDIGAISDGHSWPNYCIDWAWAARDLQMDYTTVEIDGVTYWYR